MTMLRINQMDRGGYEVPVHISLDILREALLIFCWQSERIPEGNGKRADGNVARLDSLAFSPSAPTTMRPANPRISALEYRLIRGWDTRRIGNEKV